MNHKIKLFIRSAGCLLVITGLAKIASSLGHAGILAMPDPVFQVPYHKLFLVVGILEMGVGAYCLYAKDLAVASGVVAAISTTFLIYRLGMNWAETTQPCPCLGSLTDALKIPPAVADLGMKCALGFMLAGSYACCGLLLRSRRTPLSKA